MAIDISFGVYGDPEGSGIFCDMSCAESYLEQEDMALSGGPDAVDIDSLPETDRECLFCHRQLQM